MSAIVKTLVFSVCVLSSAMLLWAAQKKYTDEKSHDSHALGEMVANLSRSVLMLDREELNLVDSVLESTTGKELAQQLRGHWSLVFFGFTHCPHACPMTLNTLARASELPGSSLANESSQVLFITVDPERDNLGQIRSYLNAFDEQFIGFTGEPSAINTTSQTFGADFEKTVAAFDHSTTLFVVNPDVELEALILRTSSPTQLLSDFNSIIAQDIPRIIAAY
jgi:protein SCO1/2